MNDLVAALAKAQQAFKPVKKSKTNPHFKSTYADLADVLAATVPALNAHGIVLVQPIEDGELVTRLMLGDAVLESRVPLNLDVKPQELGSQLTYLRRYSAASLLGVASEDDDDGNAAQETPRGVSRPSTGSGYADAKKASEAQVGLAERLLKKLYPDHLDHAGVIKNVTGESGPVADLSKANASKLIEALKETERTGVVVEPEPVYPTDEEPF